MIFFGHQLLSTDANNFGLFSHVSAVVDSSQSQPHCKTKTELKVDAKITSYISVWRNTTTRSPHYE